MPPEFQTLGFLSTLTGPLGMGEDLGVAQEELDEMFAGR